jgi:hypothetical protein
MPTSQSGANRHQLRVWLKSAIESGLLDRVPSRYDLDGSGDFEFTEYYAHRLLTELKYRNANRRALHSIVAQARQFREWVEDCQKMSPRMILGGWDSECAAARVPERLDPARPDREKRPTRPGREDGGARPDADPMWDVWLDG